MKNNGRRKLVQSAAGLGVLALAGGVPKKWITPVVESVMLPAHAQMSAVSCTVNPPLSVTCSDMGNSRIIEYYRVVSTEDSCSLESTDESIAGEGVFWVGVFSDIAGDSQFQAELNYNNSASRDFINLGIDSCGEITASSGVLSVEAEDSTGTYQYNVSAPYTFDGSAQTVSVGVVTVTRI